MKIALIGYGKMGKTIEKVAKQRGHEISVKIDKNNQDNFNSEEFINSEIAIEFSTPKTAQINYQKCFEQNIPVVSGTTGWLDDLNELVSQVEINQYSFLYSSNFSVGMNILFWLNKQLSEMMDKIAIYDASISETHHIHKKDTPSGTAISLAEDILHNIERLDHWKLSKEVAKNELPIKSIREGKVFGIHEVKYESGEDIIKISHEAKGREGFALGAVIAAEFLLGKRGFFTLDDVLNF